jgi:hypothetical protein
MRFRSLILVLRPGTTYGLIIREKGFSDGEAYAIDCNGKNGNDDKFKDCDHVG